jgi:MinD-like ATPase involved in chromosome partitioning or flagellar assembly/AmiR/NasT family two-component response regulator
MSDDGRPRLVLGLTPLTERQVEEQLFRAGTLAVVGSAANAGELAALADRHHPDAVLCSAEFPGLDAACCARLRTSGVRLLGLTLDERNAETLHALGVDALVRPPLDPDDLAAACSTGAAAVVATPEPVEARAAERHERARAGSLLAVVPGGGSPGASECACSLAALADRRWPTLLIELDLLGGGLDVRLGADPQQGSLLALIRAPSGDGSLHDLLERWTAGGDRGWPAVLLAPPDPDAHIGELAQPGAIRAALDAACTAYPLVLVDVGGLLATPGELPQATRCHREALLSADAVLVVLGAREQQLRAGRAQLARLLAFGVKRDRIRIAVNGTGAPGAARKRELEVALNDELAAFKLAVDAWLPHDARAAKRARGNGLPFVLARPHGRYTRALRGLLGELLLPTQPIARERKARLPVPVAVPSAEPVVDEEVQLPWRN